MCHFNTWAKCLQDSQISFWLFKKFFSHTSDCSPHHCEFTSHSSDFFPLRILNLHLTILFFWGGIPIYIPQFWISLLKKVTDFLSHTSQFCLAVFKFISHNFDFASQNCYLHLAFECLSPKKNFLRIPRKTFELWDMNTITIVLFLIPWQK